MARARPALAGSLIAVAAVVMFGVARLAAIDRWIEAAPEIRVGIVQGNLAVQEKNDVHYFETNSATYRDLTAGLGDDVDVVIWPESVITEPIPRTLTQLPQSFVKRLGIRSPLLTGALTYGGTPEAPQYYNSVVGIDAGGRVLGVSDKIILMPFGEYMPLGSVLPFLKRLSPMTGDFAAGVDVVPLDVPDVGRFAPLNCYEDLLAPIARRAMRTSDSEVLFAVANDAWFGPTESPYQHEALALWRAVENRRHLVRVTNTGVTDVIDPAGRVLLRLPPFEPAARVVVVRKLRGTTFYTRFGDVFAWLATVASVAALVIARRRQ
jgi:apolipoprotein N-acyltransferase